MSVTFIWKDNTLQPNQNKTANNIYLKGNRNLDFRMNARIFVLFILKVK